MFPLCGVISCAREVGIFACGEGRRNTDYRNGRGVDRGLLGGRYGEFGKVGFRFDVVG